MKGPTLLSLLLCSLSLPLVGADYPSPIMVQPGEEVLSRSFDSAEEIDKATFSFRKEAHHHLEKGSLVVLPPVVAYQGQQKDTKWADSSMARAGVNQVPLELVCQVRWQYLKPDSAEELKRVSAYLDLGHRCIRVTFTNEGTTLLLENHLVGRESGESAIVLQEEPDLQLVPGQWYDITIEVKGDEVVFQIDGTTLYGKHDLIAQERYDTFNIDAAGVGYLIDEIRIFRAGDHQPGWESAREALLQ